MLNRYDWKNIVKRIIIGVGIAFILFNINKCNAHALVFKGKDYNNGFVQRNMSGTISTPNTIKVVRFEFATPIDKDAYEGIDLFGIKFDRINFKKYNDFDIDNPEASWSSISYSFQCTNGANGYCSTANISRNVQGLAQSLYGDLITGDITVVGYVLQNGGSYIPCWFSNEIENTLLCPMLEDNIKFLDIEISYTGFDNISYDLFVGNMKVLYNYDSTEIVNGLSGIQTQQQQTNTIISDTNTSSSQSSANTGINSMNSQITQQVDSLASINTYNSIINNFFTQINNSTCSPITLPMPFVQGKNIVLPCIGTEINNSAPTLWTFWRFMCAGIIGFALWGNMITFIKGVVDPYNIGANNLPLGGGK